MLIIHWGTLPIPNLDSGLCVYYGIDKILELIFRQLFSKLGQFGFDFFLKRDSVLCICK